MGHVPKEKGIEEGRNKKGNVYMYSMYNDLEHLRKQDHKRQ